MMQPLLEYVAKMRHKLRLNAFQDKCNRHAEPTLQRLRNPPRSYMPNDQCCSVYGRLGAYYITSYMYTDVGTRLDIGEQFLAARDSAQEIGETIIKALNASAGGLKYDSPEVLAKLRSRDSLRFRKARSWTDLYRTSSHASVYREGSTIKVSKGKLACEGPGMEADGEEEVYANPTVLELGQIIMTACPMPVIKPTAKPKKNKEIDVDVEPPINEEHIGCDLRITRAEHWASNEDQMITVEEWRAVVEADPELELINEAESDSAEWLPNEISRDVIFDLDEGNIHARKPAYSAARKMLDIARRLQGQVVDEDSRPCEADILAL